MDYAVDLHGLTVTEAMEKLKDALNSASAKGKSKLGITTLDSGLIRVIVRGERIWLVRLLKLVHSTAQNLC